VPESSRAPELLRTQFESVKDLGVHPVIYRRQVYHWVQLFECRNLR
jgi:hypothetical protein